MLERGRVPRILMEPLVDTLAETSQGEALQGKPYPHGMNGVTPVQVRRPLESSLQLR